MKQYEYHIFNDGNGYCEVDKGYNCGILHFTHEISISFRFKNRKVEVVNVNELNCECDFNWDLSRLDEREQTLLNDVKAYIESQEQRKEQCA